LKKYNLCKISFLEIIEINTQKETCKNVRTAHVCAYHCAQLSQHNTAQSSSHHLPSYPPDKHQGPYLQNILGKSQI